MVKSVIINSSNLLDTYYHNTFRYTFPQGSIILQDGDQVGLASISVPYSWYNISTYYDNRTYRIYWFDSLHPYGDFSQYLDIQMDEGHYTICCLNKYLQQVLIQQGWYLIDGQNYVFYAEFIWNPSASLVQLVCYPIPSVIGSLSYPVGSTWTVPLQDTCPVIEILSNNNFQYAIGFEPGFYPDSYQSNIYTVLATNVDKLEPVNSIIVTCSILNNKYAIPPTLFFSAAIDTPFGSQVIMTPGEVSYIDVQASNYAYFDISLLDEYNRPINVRDTDITILVYFLNRSELRNMLS